MDDREFLVKSLSERIGILKHLTTLEIGAFVIIPIMLQLVLTKIFGWGIYAFLGFFLCSIVSGFIGMMYLSSAIELSRDPKKAHAKTDLADIYTGISILCALVGFLLIVLPFIDISIN